MGREPMSEEQKKKLSEQAKARIAAKKAEEQATPAPEPTDATAPVADGGVESPVAPEPEPSEAPDDADQTEPQEPETAPAVDSASDQVEQASEEANDEPEQTKPKDYVDFLPGVQEARDEIRAIQNHHPDMIEAKQAADALDNAIYFMGQVQSTLESK